MAGRAGEQMKHKCLLLKLWDWLGEFLNGTYAVGHNRALQQQVNQLGDFFMLITFSECLGLPNPYGFYTIDQLPELIPAFHKWHTRMGLHANIWERFPCGCC